MNGKATFVKISNQNIYDEIKSLEKSNETAHNELKNLHLANKSQIKLLWWMSSSSLGIAGFLVGVLLR